MRRAAILVVALALLSCHPTKAAQDRGAGGAVAPAPSDTSEARISESATSHEPDDECGAGKLGRWLNLLPTEPVKGAIRETVGDRPIRYLAPGDKFTMDFRPKRLNVENGEDGRIKKFRCG